MTSSEEVKTALSAKLNTLQALSRTGGDGIALIARDRHLTSLVSDALDRARNETYGLCVACEQRISPRRLAALPWARYCIACQEMKEGFAPEIRLNNAA